MPYRLTQDEPIPEGLRRIVREEIDSAVAQLRTARSSRTKDPARRDEGIHEARKSIKKVRGIVRLLMPGMGDGGKRENQALRDAGRLLSEFRDAAAIVETVDALLEKYAGDPAAKDLASVRALLAGRRNESEARNDAAAAIPQAIAALTGFKRRANTWIQGEDGFSLLAPGLRASYRRGRKALARAGTEPTPLNCHELRKRVKEHWYHVRLLENLGNLSPAREKSLKDMQEWLGEDHNLVVLEEIIAANPGAFGDDEARAGVHRLIDKYRAELRGNALSHGEHLYEAKPGDFMRRLRRLWDAWRNRPAAAAAATAKRSASAA